MIFRRKTPADLMRFDVWLCRFRRDSPIRYHAFTMICGVLIFLIALCLQGLLTKVLEGL